MKVLYASNTMDSGSGHQLGIGLRHQRGGQCQNASSIQPGQAIHSNLAVSYAVAERWRVGVAGYQLKQISDDRIDGHRQQDSREQVVGIGPGVMYQQGKRTFFANLYFESGAENRAQGTQLTLRYLQAF